MDVHSLPYDARMLRSMLSDFEIGQFGEGLYGKICRGRAALQFYLRADSGDITVQIHASSGLMLVSSGPPISAYLRSVAKRHGVSTWDIHWEYDDLARILSKRRYEPVEIAAVLQELPWSMLTFKERGILIACGRNIAADDSLPQDEVPPLSSVGTALAFFKDLIPWTAPKVPIDYTLDRMIRDCDTDIASERIADIQETINRACMARNAVILRLLLRKGPPSHAAYDPCIANKDATCMEALAKVLLPTGEQLHAIARVLELPDFMRVYRAMTSDCGDVAPCVIKERQD